VTQADEFIKKKLSEGIKVTYTAIAAKSIGNSYANIKRNHGKIIFGR
jgi:hypothetical protein